MAESDRLPITQGEALPAPRGDFAGRMLILAEQMAAALEVQARVLGDEQYLRTQPAKDIATAAQVTNAALHSWVDALMRIHAAQNGAGTYGVGEAGRQVEVDTHE